MSPSGLSLAPRIVAAVAAHFGLTVEALRAPNRKSVFSTPRHVAAYFIREFLGYSYGRMAHCVGRKDKTTAMYSAARVRYLAGVDPEFARALSTLRARLES